MSRKIRALLLAFALLVPAADAALMATTAQPDQVVAVKKDRRTTLWT